MSINHTKGNFFLICFGALVSFSTSLNAVEPTRSKSSMGLKESEALLEPRILNEPESQSVVGFSFFHEVGLAYAGANLAVGGDRQLLSQRLNFNVGLKPHRDLMFGLSAQREALVQHGPARGTERIPSLSGTIMSIGLCAEWRHGNYFLSIQRGLLKGRLDLDQSPDFVVSKGTAMNQVGFDSSYIWRFRAGLQIYNVLYLYGAVHFMGFDLEQQNWPGTPENEIARPLESNLSMTSYAIGTAIIF